MIDLHIHTNHSDGTDSVKELLEKAENKKIEVISITDHNKIDAYKEIENNLNLRKIYSGEIIIGSELKTSYKGISIEVLAYGFDYNKLLTKDVDNEKIQKKILEELIKIADKIGLKYDIKNLYIDLSDFSKQFASAVIEKELLKYPENEKIIKEIGEFKDISFFRAHQTNKNSIFYIDETKYYPEINELINIIHKSGGLAFLAHGYIYPFEDKDKEIEEILKTTNIDGIECEYPLFSNEERNKAKKLAKKYNKFMSGGTDYHAKNKPNIELGTGINNNIHISKNLINNWINKVNKI